MPVVGLILAIFTFMTFITPAYTYVRIGIIIVDLVFLIIIYFTKIRPSLLEKRRIRQYNNEEREQANKRRYEMQKLIEEEQIQLEKEELELQEYLSSLSPEELEEYHKQKEKERLEEKEKQRIWKEKREAGREAREAEAMAKKARKEQEKLAEKEKQDKLTETRKVKEAKEKAKTEQDEKKAKQNNSSRTSSTKCCVTCAYWEGTREIGNTSRTLVIFPFGVNGRCRRSGIPLSGESRGATQNCGKVYKKWEMLR